MNYKITILFLSFIFLSCSEKTGDNILSVSIEPQKYFLEAIVRDKYKVNCVIPAGSDPETFDPSPAQMVKLGKSKIYFKAGSLPFENAWIKNIQENNPGLAIVDCSAGIELVEDDHAGHNHGHEGTDPHIWSSPQTAAQMAGNMLDAIICLDPDNSGFYTDNYNKLLREFAETDSIIRLYLADSKEHSFIIYHPALTYFSHEYNLHQYSVETDGKSPSPAQLKNLVDMAKEKNIKVVFMQEEYDKKNIETIAREINGKIIPVNLLSYNWSSEMIKIAKAFSSDNE